MKMETLLMRSDYDSFFYKCIIMDIFENLIILLIQDLNL
jgi:hypothetical protein